MTRILHIIDSLDYSGAAKQLLVLSRGLVERGNEVHVAALKERGALRGEFAAAGISVVELNRRWGLNPVAYAALLRVMRRLRPQVVHTWGGGSNAIGQAAARSAGVPNVVVGYYQREPWKDSWRWFVERRLAGANTRYVADSEHIRDWCVRNGLPAKGFVVIPPGVAPAAGSDVSRDELLRELKLPADARLIGVIGQLQPEKRVTDLIWAADLLRVLHDNLRLLVIGVGPQQSALKQYARLASDLDHIQFMGERADVWRIMPHLDVLWNSDEPRGHAMAILEAMAAGVPVIASDTPLNRELVIENETGFLVPLNERAGRATRARHTDRIFTDSELRSRLGGTAQGLVAEQFSAALLVERYLRIYDLAD